MSDPSNGPLLLSSVGKPILPGWKFQAYEAMADALSVDGIEGDETTSMPGRLATYQFLFPYGQMRIYGKIALRNDRLRILIISAHRAKRDTL